MADRALPLKAHDVRALLAGTKSQHRMVLKPQPSDFQGAKVPPAGKSWVNKKHDAPFLALHDDLEHWCWWDEYANQGPDWFKVRWAKGDHLYVREHWRTEAKFDALAPRDLSRDAIHSFEADYDGEPNDGCRGRFRQGMHMPRWASRLTLEVSDVRVERLQDISAGDALAEGVSSTDHWRPKDVECKPFEDKWWDDFTFWSEYPQLAYRELWESINGAGSWATNPFVIAVSFSVHRGNIDQLARAS